jgi:hypothetical protein
MPKAALEFATVLMKIACPIGRCMVGEGSAARLINPYTSVNMKAELALIFSSLFFSLTLFSDPLTVRSIQKMLCGLCATKFSFFLGHSRNNQSYKALEGVNPLTSIIFAE